jgi:hypothetical protein
MISCKYIPVCLGRQLFLFVIFMLAFTTFSNSQNIVVSSQLDTNKILIGDQINLNLKVQATTGTGIIFPVLKDTLREHVEIISQSKIDTNYSPDKQRYELSKRITITSFDSGYWAIPPFKFFTTDDTVHPITTTALLLSVQTIPVDTTKAFRDIKPPLNAPFTFNEVLPYIIGFALLNTLIIATYYFIRYRKRKSKTEPEKVKIIIPPHIEALELLQLLRDEKLWQNGFEKEYHSRISDIVRNYIERRFGLTALEQTTDEIMRHTRTIEVIDDTLRS